MQNRSGKKKKNYAFASKVVVGNPNAKRPGISGHKRKTKLSPLVVPDSRKYTPHIIGGRTSGKSTIIEPPAWVLENRDPTRAEGKGVKGGLCNMRSCLKPGAYWYNQGSHAYYCEETACELNRVNRANWRANFPDQGPEMCFDDTDGTVTRHVSG